MSQVHFEEVHSKEDAAFVKSLKDLFSKAKSAVTSSEEAVDEISPQPRLRLAPERTDIDPVSGVCALRVLCVLCVMCVLDHFITDSATTISWSSKTVGSLDEY